MSERESSRPEEHGEGESRRSDADARGAEGSDDPIELEPSEPEPKRGPPPASGRGRVEGPGLLDDFDEDEDLTSDPEVERVVRGIPIEKREGAGARPQRRERPLRKPEVFSQPEEPESTEPLCDSSAWRLPAGIGAVIAAVAAVLAGVYADHTIWAFVLITIYWAALHTGTGLGALVITGLVQGRRVGSFEGAAARMLLCVALFLVVYSLDIPITGGKLEEVLLAAAAYFGGLVVSFRMSPQDAGLVGALHFGVALLLWLGGMLRAAIETGGAGAVGAGA